MVGALGVVVAASLVGDCVVGSSLVGDCVVGSSLVSDRVVGSSLVSDRVVGSSLAAVAVVGYGGVGGVGPSVVVVGGTCAVVEPEPSWSQKCSANSCAANGSQSASLGSAYCYRSCW